MKESEVTDEQIIAEAKVLFEHPHLRRCNACAHSDEECTYCYQMKKPLRRYMYAGMCRFFETHEERIIRETREAMRRQEKMDAKLNRLLTMALNCIDASMLFLEDFAQRVEKDYKIADAKGIGSPKAKKADRNWIANFKKANRAMANNIEGARKQYQHYVMPIFNKIFFDKDVQKYDVEMYDDHQSDCSELAHLILRYFDVAYLNKANADAILEHIKSMDSCGVMEESDFNHYNFRR